MRWWRFCDFVKIFSNAPRQTFLFTRFYGGKPWSQTWHFIPSEDNKEKFLPWLIVRNKMSGRPWHRLTFVRIPESSTCTYTYYIPRFLRKVIIILNIPRSSRERHKNIPFVVRVHFVESNYLVHRPIRRWRSVRQICGICGPCGNLLGGNLRADSADHIWITSNRRKLRNLQRTRLGKAHHVLIT